MSAKRRDSSVPVQTVMPCVRTSTVALAATDLSPVAISLGMIKRDHKMAPKLQKKITSPHFTATSSNSFGSHPSSGEN